MSKNEEKDFKQIADAVVPAIGSKDNAVEAFHCATRLRINLKDPTKVNTDGLADLPLVKGVNLNTTSNQLQLIIGPGLIDRVTAYFVKYTGIPAQSNQDDTGDTPEKANQDTKKRNWFQEFLDDLTGVFTEVLPAILAGGIFAMLPLIIAYSATKRYGGRPVLGLAIGTVMMSQSLPVMADVATHAAKPMIANVFGWHVSMTSFGGQIIVALIMGWLVAKLDNYFQKHLPGVIQFVLAPMLTILISSLALFLVVGPIGVTLSNWITTALLWVANTLGVFGYAAFSGVQQLIVITGLHNMFGAVETQLIELKTCRVLYLICLMLIMIFCSYRVLGLRSVIFADVL